jgi:tetratricopeptide (TPR) repeat protein
VVSDQIVEMARAGLAALRSGDFVRAAQIGEEATRVAPARADGWLVLTAALTRMGSVDAERAMADGLAAIPLDDPARVMLEADRARALALRGRAGEAAEIAFQLETRPQLPARQRDTLGSVFATIGLFDHAVRHCEVAVAALPKDPLALYNYATALRYVGRIDEAEAVFERSLAIDPDSSVAHASLAALRKWSAEKNHIERLRAAAARAAHRAEDAGRLHHALFKELNDAGRHEEAWQALEKGAATVHALWPYPLAEKRARLDALIDTFSATRLSHAPAHATPGHKPIFIYGLPRSGTTLTERILAAHSRVTAMGETSAFMQTLRTVAGQPRAKEIDEGMIRRAGDLDYARVADLYVRHTAYLAPGAEFATEKLPHNYEFVGPIHLASPAAPLIHVRRAPMDSLFGAFRLMFGEAAYLWSYSFEDLAENYRQYRRLMAHWRAALGDRILEVRLEALIDDPEPHIRRLLDHCGLAFEPACLSPHETDGGVSTASSSQVRRPINREGVGAWRRYERQLEPLRAMLERDGFVDRNGDPVD